MKTHASWLGVLFLVPMVAGILNAQTNAESRAPVAQACPTMEVSVVAADSMHSSRHVSAPDGTVISLTDTPLLTMGDFTDANVSVVERQIVLNVSMSAGSAKRVQTFTASHVGVRLAFLANGRVINTPKILDPITGKGFLIGPLSRDEAQKLAGSINHRDRGCEAQGKDSM
jgi:preprotein translocase subunit SecD